MNKYIIIIFAVVVVAVAAVVFFYFQPFSAKQVFQKPTLSPTSQTSENLDTVLDTVFLSDKAFLQYHAFTDTCAGSICFVSLTNSIPEDVGIGFIIKIFDIPSRIAEYGVDIPSNQTLDNIVAIIDKTRQESHYTPDPTYGGTVRFISKKNITLNGIPAIEQEIVTKKFYEGKEIYHKLFYFIRNNSFYKIRYSYPLNLSSQAKPFTPEIESAVASIKFFNNEIELKAAQQQLVVNSGRVYKSKFGYGFQYPSGYRLERLTSAGIFYGPGLGEVSIFARRLGVQLVNESNNSVELLVYDNQDDLLARRGTQSPKNQFTSFDDFKKIQRVIKNEEVKLSTGMNALRQLYDTFGDGRKISDHLGERIIIQSGKNFVIFRPTTLNLAAEQKIQQEITLDSNGGLTEGLKSKIIETQDIFDETLLYKVIKELSLN